MNINCKNCHSSITSENVNIATDVAMCSSCDSVFKASELIKGSKKVDLTPPTGSTIEVKKGFNRDVEIKLSDKKITFAKIFPFIFCTFWLGFISFWTWGASQGSIIFALFSPTRLRPSKNLEFFPLF